MHKRTRILYIQPNSEVGGSDIAVLRMVGLLDRSRYEPIVLLPGDGPTVPLLREIGAQVRLLPMAQLRSLPCLGYQLGYAGAFWPTVRRIARLIEADQIDLVHTNSLYSLCGGWAARLTKRPHVWHVREIPPAVPVLRPLLGRMVLALATHVIAMTRACAEGLFGNKDLSPKVTCAADGLDLKEWGLHVSGARIRSELGIPAEAPVIGFVGRLDPWKGLDVFLKAAAIIRRRFPDAQFLVSGDAPQGFEQYAQKMRKLASSLRLGGCVHFLGWRYRMKDIPEVMAALTVFSHTSVQPEPFGLVLVEAMAMERPVVAARAGGPLEIVLEGQTGHLTAPGDPQAHAEAVCALLADPERRRRIGQAARRRVETNFSTESFREVLDHVYDRALST